MFPLCAPGEDENLEEMLDNHEFRRPVFGDGDGDFGMLPFNVAVFSGEVLLEKPGRWGGIGFGAVGAASFACLPLFNSLSDGDATPLLCVVCGREW